MRRELKKGSISSLLVSKDSNVTYLSGFKGSDSVLFITQDSGFFLTDSRYTQEAKASVSGLAVMEVTSSTYDTIGGIVRRNGIKRIGFEAMNLPYQVVKNLEGHLGGARLLPTMNIVERLRVIKDSGELSRIRSSVKLMKKILKKALDVVRPGLSEKALSARIECEFLKAGAKPAFQTIVACGKNSSKPHAQPTDAKISKDDAVMIDMGCALDSYCSDITRMALIGRVKDRIKELCSIVRTAQERALEAIAPGRRISEVDRAGRQYIADKGYGKFFGHSMGHGVGLEVHEEPSVSGRSKGILRPGMVFTVEPAIYMPGLGGVRIEDMVLVTDSGYEILTR